MNLPDDLADLERDLAARSRSDPSPNLRPRVLSALAHELSQPSTSASSLPARRSRPRQFLIATGIAATVALTFTVWQSSSPLRPPSPPSIPHSAIPLLSPDDRLTTWRDCRQALNHSPLALDQLLEKNAAKPKSSQPQTMLHTHSNFLALSGDL